MISNLKKQLNKIPVLSGVYLFKDNKRKIIYIGKAINLRVRIKSYFSQKLYGLKASMLTEIAKIDYEITDTEIDALILESQLIKKYRPKYNVMLKDDKNYFYVVFTSGEFPKLFITHQPQKVESLKFKVKSEAKIKNKNLQSKNKFQISNFRLQVLGPYTDGQALKTTLRYLRKVFPYCTCKNQHEILCLKSHLGLCVGVCCLKQRRGINAELTRKNSEFKKAYAKNIEIIINILSGKRKNILRKLEKEMKIAAKREDFEKAAFLRNKISALNNVFQHKIIGVKDYDPRNHGGRASIIAARDEISRIFGIKINRIEFYDVSNISGQLATASMAVFDGERINRSKYRKFKIKTIFGADDPAMMREILTRRLNHKEWGTPELIIVDGGISQFGVAQKVLKNSKIKGASLAKNPDRLFVSSLKQISLKDLSRDLSLFLRNLRDEAHRFAIAYHRKLRSKKLKSDFYIK
ncbi:MAG: Excinuclease ABC C subunit domain protein [Parcubacteria group bacterium GW2011_GWC1_38_17]|nr:MAG: Excinuclease ABC C subunit domain protein [Parcubacteria group bacterium GW2011_GWC2_36_17]KKQ58501.1 MAG: Excinuclease ABC C subunit domain protein [Parcubacteria group bacterium GW2011_GWC1_38_17]KKQ59764.1 MAG: Excinuclease ABC C subunit domain protein [Parcubacteria group bacterium GW2011_GWD1_38_16]